MRNLVKPARELKTDVTKMFGDLSGVAPVVSRNLTFICYNAYLVISQHPFASSGKAASRKESPVINLSGCLFIPYTKGIL
jgi:hypothetical protein